MDKGEQLADLEREYQYLFTVFTPTYNRAHTLHRVYDSLKAQTFRDFEWLIVDDGSTDSTYELITHWQQEKLFPIRYIYQENAGKHIAFNRGVREAKSELFLTLDSDDSCVPEALERFKHHWDGISSHQKIYFAGVTCLCKDKHGQLVGSYFPSETVDSNYLEIRYKFKVKGEKWDLHYLKVLREFPFPESIKQACIPESLVWNKFARKYKTRFINEVLRIYWIEGESLAHGGKPSKSAIGNSMMHLSALNEHLDWLPFAPLAFFRSAVHYSRFSFHLGDSIFQQFKSVRTSLGKVLWLANFPLGYLVYLKDRISVILLKL